MEYIFLKYICLYFPCSIVIYIMMTLLILVYSLYESWKESSYIKDVFSSLGTITTGDSEATCATSLLSSYNAVTISDSTGSTTCSSTEMDGCADRTEMRYTYDASCGSTLKFSSQFYCEFDLSLMVIFIFFSSLLSLFISNYLKSHYIHVLM